MSEPTTSTLPKGQTDKKRHFKVVRFRILKPADAQSWSELGKTLRDVRYRVFRLANLIVSENYLAFHLFRTGKTKEYKTAKPSELNKRLRAMLIEEEKNKPKAKPTDPDRFSKTGALPDTVSGALTQYKVKGLTNKSKWAEVLRGKASLPTFRLDMAIPIRCDKPGQRRLEKHGNNVELDLMITVKPYPRVVLQTGDVGGSARATLDRLLANPDQKPDGYKQRNYEVKQDSRTGKWWLYVTYDFPAQPASNLNPEIVVGVDLGVSVPLYAAINNGHARLGRRAFQALGARIRSLQNQVMARRRDIQRGGSTIISGDSARSGHGRKRKLKPIEPLEGRISNAYTTLNHQLSTAVIKFALDHGAGVIQIEDLTGLKDELTGTFIGAFWRYHQLQQFLAYKAKESGIELRKVNPRYTSRRCSRCGTININFDRKTRDANARPGFSARFACVNPECECAEKPVDADYNAARNLATPDIERLIRQQCKQQGLDYGAAEDDDG
jgi:putative transposase